MAELQISSDERDSPTMAFLWIGRLHVRTAPSGYAKPSLYASSDGSTRLRKHAAEWSALLSLSGV